MKKCILFAFCLAALTTTAKAQWLEEGNGGGDIPRLEVGIVAGVPTGLSVKYWLAERSAVDVGGGWSFDEERLELYADYLFHYFRFDMEEAMLPVYFGLGAGLQLGDDDTFIGVRIPLGASYLFPNAPFSVFAEVAPIMEVIPDTEFDVGGGVGLRLTFGSVPFID